MPVWWQTRHCVREASTGLPWSAGINGGLTCVEVVVEVVVVKVDEVVEVVGGGELVVVVVVVVEVVVELVVLDGVDVDVPLLHAASTSGITRSAIASSQMDFFIF
jgi:hypothetical protein